MPEVQNILEQTVQIWLQIYNWNINSLWHFFAPFFFSDTISCDISNNISKIVIMQNLN